MSKDVLKSTAVVGLGTGLSRLLGLVREILMAVVFGTSLAKSAFDVAFRIPNLFRRLFGEGALSAVFVPVFTEVREREGTERANVLFGHVGTLLASALFIIVGLGILILLAIENLWELGPKAAAVVPLLRIMLPYVFFLCLVGLCMGTLNSLGHFALPAMTPILLNLVWIASLLWICPRFGTTPDEQIYGLALGILAAGAIQLLVQFPVLTKMGIRPRLSFGLSDEKVKRMLILMGPAALGVGVHQVNVVIDGILALWVGPWAPAALTYAERMIYLPLGIIATALGTVLLPTFSKQAASVDMEGMMRTLNASMRNILLIMVPAAMGLIVLARPIVQLVFTWEGGMFDASSELYTARAMAFYGAGLVVFSLYKVMVPAFYAMQDMRTPVRVGLWAVGLNFVLNITFILTWPAGFKHAGLALATVIASGVNCFVLGVLLHRRHGGLDWSGIGRALLCAAFGSLGMSAIVRASHFIFRDACSSVSLHEKWVQLISVGGAILVGMVVYALWIVVFPKAGLEPVAKKKGEK